VITLGIVARKQVRKKTKLGNDIWALFRRHKASKELRRNGRRRLER
jgi:hypothetical protein